MTALEPRRDSRPPGDRLDHAVVIALGLAAAALAVAGLTSQRLGVPVALWVAAGGAVPLSLGMLLIAHERARRGRETERIKRRETAAVLAEKLAEARRRSDSLERPSMGDDVSSVPYPTDEPPGPVLEVVTEPDPEPQECSSVERVAQLEETLVNLNRQVEELTEVIRGASRGVRSNRSGRHSGPPEDNAPADIAELTEEPA